MRINILAAAFIALATSVSAQSFNDILGKTLSNDEGSIVINRNGTVRGTLNGLSVNLKWTVEEGKFCRQGTVGTHAVAKSCQTIAMSADRVTFRGGGTNSSYRITN